MSESKSWQHKPCVAPVRPTAPQPITGTPSPLRVGSGQPSAGAVPAKRGPAPQTFVPAKRAGR